MRFIGVTHPPVLGGVGRRTEYINADLIVKVEVTGENSCTIYYNVDRAGNMMSAKCDKSAKELLSQMQASDLGPNGWEPF
jgi:hypothetical protein